MPYTTPSTPKVDLLTQILEVDLSTPRNFKWDPMPEGHVALGTMSTNAQRAFWFGFDIAEEVLAIHKTIADAENAHITLHMSGEITDDACVEYHTKMADLEKKLTNLTFIEQGLAGLVASMIQNEFPEVMCAADSLPISEGFVISKNPAQQEELGHHVIQVRINFTKPEPSEKSDASQNPEKTTVAQPTNDEELVSPEES